MSIERCVPEEALEQYVLGKLTEVEATTVEEHLLVCADCQQRVTELDEYVPAMRLALVAVDLQTVCTSENEEGVRTDLPAGR